MTTDQKVFGSFLIGSVLLIFSIIVWYFVWEAPREKALCLSMQMEVYQTRGGWFCVDEEGAVHRPPNKKKRPP